jgi:hypothetical protein
MISLEKFKESLGSTAQELSEKEILEIRDNQDQMAELFFSMWLKKAKEKMRQ